MASVKSLLQRKLEKLLAQRFPPPATIRLENHNGIVGVITSGKFAGLEPIDRQALIGDLLATQLTPEERRRVQIIVAVTPDEGTGYLASPKD
jgi:stress-induced morphogen